MTFRDIGQWWQNRREARHPRFIVNGVCATVITYLPRTICGRRPVVTHWRFHEGFFSMTCKDHVAGDGKPYHIAQSHDVAPNCGMPGTYWDVEKNMCIADDDFLAHVEAEFKVSETVTA